MMFGYCLKEECISIWYVHIIDFSTCAFENILILSGTLIFLFQSLSFL